MEEYEGAQEQLMKERYKNATILFSKALFALCDVLIDLKLKRLPKNHGERFRILEEYFPKVYFIVDNLFSDYTDAYYKSIAEEVPKKIKNEIKKIAEFETLPKEIKEIIR